MQVRGLGAREEDAGGKRKSTPRGIVGGIPRRARCYRSFGGSAMLGRWRHAGIAIGRSGGLVGVACDAGGGAAR